MLGMRAKKTVFTVLRYIAIIIGALICLFPIYIMVTTSLKNEVEAFSIPPTFIFKPILDNYVAILTENNFSRYFINSVIIALASTFISISASTLAAHPLARKSFVGKSFFSAVTFLMRMIPPVILVVPVFVMFRNLNILNSRLSLIFVYAALTMPFAIWVITTFISQLPIELEEAAYLDGCTPFQTFRKIVVPLITPGLSVAAIFTFRTAWNEFILSLVLTNRTTRTLPVAVSLYITDAGIDWGKITAIATIIAIPAFIFTFFAAKQLITGITAGAVKG